MHYNWDYVNGSNQPTKYFVSMIFANHLRNDDVLILGFLNIARATNIFHHYSVGNYVFLPYFVP